MGHIRQTIHNLLGKVLPRRGARRAQGSYTLANGLADAKTNLNETHVLDSLAPREALAALVAMAPMIADHDAPDWGGRLAAILFGDDRPRTSASVRREAETALAARWLQLSPDARGLFAARGDLAGAVRDGWAGADVAARASHVQALIDHAWRGAPDLLIEALADPDPEIARAAGRGIERLAQRALAEPILADEVESLVSRAIVTFDLHQSRAVLSASIVLAAPVRRRGPAWIAAAEREELRAALGGALRSGTDPVYRLRAWEHLAQPWLAPSAVARLWNGACTTEEHDAVLGRSHLALRETRRRAVTSMLPRDRARLLAGLVPLHAGVMNRLVPGAWCGMARLMAELEDAAGRREAFARAALGHPAPRVRYAAMLAAPGKTVEDYAYDADASTARSAALRASGSDAAWTAMRRSPHAQVRDIAAQEAGLAGLSWGVTCAEALGLRRRFIADPAALERAWREAWEAGDAPARVQLLRSAARIGLLARVGAIAASAATPDAEPGTVEARVAATAAAVMAAPGATEECRRAVAACLEAKDARVRANAVEALGVIRNASASGSLPIAVIELKDDANHRVRANAVRLLASRGAIPSSQVLREVGRMLVSTEEIHRRAGVWLAGRVGAAGGPLDAQGRRGLATIIERRLRREDHALVAERLRACAARLIDDAAAAEVAPLVEAA